MKYKSQNYGIAGMHDGKINLPEEVDHFLEGIKDTEQLKNIIARIYAHLAKKLEADDLAAVIDTMEMNEDTGDITITYDNGVPATEETE